MTRRSCYAVLASLALLASLPRSVQSQHEHDAHRGTAAAVSQISLKDGAKWPTDASLRAGMASIRAAFDADHPAIHADKQTDAQYSALAARIDGQVKSIIANCRLPADADANLHFIVADLLQGVSLMRGEDASRPRHDGAHLVHGALRAYGSSFDDPAWLPETPVQLE